MIEAIACGTPVIAYQRGSVPEVMDEGQTGFIANNLDEAVEAVRRVPEIDRRACRSVFEKRFTASRMANDYMKAFDQMVQRSPRQYIELAIS
jgi:glycosyltransferase involved in cell wall biosynthesis